MPRLRCLSSSIWSLRSYQFEQARQHSWAKQFNSIYVLSLLDLCMHARVWRVIWSLKVVFYALNTYIPPSSTIVRKALYQMNKAGPPWLMANSCKSNGPFGQVRDMSRACITRATWFRCMGSAILCVNVITITPHVCPVSYTHLTLPTKA